MKQVQMPALNFIRLKATIAWYDAMPAYLEVGDRFHERMSEEMDNLLPEMEEIENDDYYNGGIEEVDGKLFMTLISTIDLDDEIEIELVPVP